MRTILFFLILIPTASFANPVCKNINKFQLALSIHASNWANAITTRTPEGGAYKIKKLDCKEQCQILEEKKVFLKYEPDHPDANIEGYVTYPDINKENERASISTYAKALKLVASECPSQVKVIDNKDSFMAEYKQGDIKLDVFNFTKESKVISWVREDKSGKLTSREFQYHL